MNLFFSNRTQHLRSKKPKELYSLFRLCQKAGKFASVPEALSREHGSYSSLQSLLNTNHTHRQPFRCRLEAYQKVYIPERCIELLIVNMVKVLAIFFRSSFYHNMFSHIRADGVAKFIGLARSPLLHLSPKLAKISTFHNCPFFPICLLL